MDKKTVYLIGGGVVIGGVLLYVRSKSKTPTAEESTPLYATGAQPASEAGAVQAAEQRGMFEANEAKQEVELGFEKELVTALEGRPTGLQEIQGAKQTLEALGIPVGAGVSAPGNTQATPSSTNSSNSESGSHLPAAPPSPSQAISNAAKALEAVPNSSHEWHLSTTGPTAGRYYYNGSYNGKSAHIYDWTGWAGFVGPHHNLVIT